MSEAKWLIGRQPILDREQRVRAYELLFRSAAGPPSAGFDPTHATASVILGALSGLGVESVLGGHRGYVNLDRELLFSDALLLLPPAAVVIELLETLAPDEQLAARCQELKAAGFTLALDDHTYDPAYEPLYPLVDVVKVDLQLADREGLARSVEKLRAWPLALLAEKVETPRQFRECLDLGFDYFQGYHFARPATIERRRLDENGATLLRLMGLLVDDAEVDLIEGAVRQSPGLSYKLLTLVNSVAMASRERIRSLRQAITLLGRRQIRRWVQLALFATDERRGLDDPLLDMAAVRAALMEGLAKLHPGLDRSKEAAEQAFMIGILSLLDRVYSMTMEEVVRTLRLSEEVGAALLRREGALGQLLDAVERMELLDLDVALDGLATTGISRAEALRAQMRAFAWRAGELKPADKG